MSLVSSLSKIKAGILGSDWSEVVVGFNELSGENLSVPSPVESKKSQSDEFKELEKKYYKLGSDLSKIKEIVDEYFVYTVEDGAIDTSKKATPKKKTVKKSPGRPKGSKNKSNESEVEDKPKKTVGEFFDENGFGVKGRDRRLGPRPKKKYKKKVCNSCGNKFEDKWGSSMCDSCLTGKAKD